MAEEKKIDIEELEQVSGGGRRRIISNAMNQEMETMIPDEVKERLRGINNIADVNRILSENGINPETFGRKVSAEGLASKKIGLTALPDEALENIGGGFDFHGTDVKCLACGNDNPAEFMLYPPFYSPDYKCYLRCDRCRQYVAIHNNGSLVYIG